MIIFDHVSKTYPRTTRPALDDVSLEVERGEFVFVVGQSGSGKSTLLRLVLREDVPTSGRILVAGRNVARLPDRKVPRLRREIGTVFQDFRLLPGKTVYANVAFALQVIGTSRSTIRQTVPETLAMVGLEGKEKRLPHELSGGEQQRVAIARAVVNKPAILLADEPTGNLDPATSADIVALLERINRRGTTVVMATHDHEIVNSYRKRVVELQTGVLQRDVAGGSYEVTGSVLPVPARAAEQAVRRGDWLEPHEEPLPDGAEAGDEDLVPVAAGASYGLEEVREPDPAPAAPARRGFLRRR
ncbi:cell division ATP-binding protein FtsE [Lapillicoccus jejuensis]|uniref:Cell division ATP-binding protein FtsE n=1 Tax=Lapillicoccus jejuensis TaxID=402171 RepID=A0A542DVW6_9MICO|nr:cell division ATP-binding protein FtsE [Lapillicoccus jejuensis]TQJ07196.1 cell division ATP-binding protein FtsE [Lapillicoccus jejuensis]